MRILFLPTQPREPYYPLSADLPGRDASSPEQRHHRIPLLLLVALMTMLVNLPLSARGSDTLSAFNPTNGYKWFRIANLQVQAARFEPVVTGTLDHVRLMLSGESENGSVRVRIFGYEGGGPVPFLERDLTEPIIVTKTHPGAEWIDVPIGNGVRIESRHFFVAVDQLAPGVMLVTDSEEKTLSCEDTVSSEIYSHQCIKTDDGRWWVSKYAFAIEAIMSYDLEPGEQWLEDVTAGVGLNDTTALIGGIAWGDYDNDLHLDMLVNGHLYRNKGDSFVDVTEQVGLKATPSAAFFLDADNDTRSDILFVNCRDEANAGLSLLFTAGENGRFIRHELAIPPVANPSSVSIADADGDGWLDLFIGQGRDNAGRGLPSMLLINDHKFGFSDSSHLITGEGGTDRVVHGSQWRDFNGDGLIDLYLINQGENASELWQRTPEGGYIRVMGSGSGGENSIISRNTLGGFWQDADDDGIAELAASQHVSLSSVKGRVDNIGTIVRKGSESSRMEYPVDAGLGIAFAERRGAGVWADVNNDGNLDIYLASASRCRNADIYIGAASGYYSHRTSSFGLLHRAAGPDGVWVDYDNDGKLDLATVVGDRLKLYRNTITTQNNYLEIDLGSAQSDVTKVTVHAGDLRIARDVISGRGILMQDPLRLHFGLERNARVDSVALYRADGTVETLSEIRINSVMKLRGERASSGDGRLVRTISAYPNPFTDKISISFELTSKVGVRLEIFDLQGETVSNLLTGAVMAAGRHEITWKAVDGSGAKLPAATYIYRLSVNGVAHTGRLVLNN